MAHAYTDKGLEMQEAVKSFMDDHIYPNEEEYNEQYEELVAAGQVHATPAIMEKLKAAARERGLWNLFIPRRCWRGSSARPSR